MSKEYLDRPQNSKISVTPSVLPSNSFVRSFSHAIARSGRSIRDSKWKFRGLISSDVAILHWPDCFFLSHRKEEAQRKLLKMRLARRLFGTRFIWVAHNPAPHGAGRPSEGSSAFIGELDGIIHLCAASYDIINARYAVRSDILQVVTVHGRYDSDRVPHAFRYPIPDTPIKLLSCGLLKPYKNLEVAIEAMLGLDQREANLRVLGKDCDARYVESLRTLSASNPAITIEAVDDLLSDAQVEDALDECDLFIIPYGEILNSGAAMLALSRNRPIIAPRIGGLPELRDQVGAEWIYLYDGLMSQAALKEGLHWLRSTPRGASPDLSNYDWKRVSEDLDRILNAL